MKVGDSVVSEAGMSGTVIALRFGRLGDGPKNPYWIARVAWHGRYPSTDHPLRGHPVASLRKC